MVFNGFVLHLDEVQGFAGRLLVLRHHRRHRIADVTDVLGRERIFVLADRQDAEGHREVFAGQDQMHARIGFCF